MSRLAPLLALAGIACAAACSKADDAPGAEPTCQILWASLGSLQDRFDVYLIEMKEDEWALNGERTFSFEDGVYGMVYDEFEEATGLYVGRGVATEGTFTVSSSQGVPAPGGTIAVDDDVPQTYYDLNGADEVLSTVLGTGGIATFAGVWSDESTVTPGSGTAAVTIGTSGQVIGSYVRYAQCFDPESGSSASSAATTSRWPRPRFPR